MDGGYLSEKWEEHAAPSDNLDYSIGKPHQKWDCG